MIRQLPSDAAANGPSGCPGQASADWPTSEIERSMSLTSEQRAALDEFRAAITRLGFAVTVEAAFEVQPGARGARKLGAEALSWARRVLERLGLVPRTLQGRARLKRLIYGRLLRTPAELPEGFAPTRRLHPVPPGPVTIYKVIYVKGTKPLSPGR